MKSAELFLAIAEQHLHELDELSGPVTVGSDEVSDHVRLGLICSVFSAFAVEHAMSELIWVRCFLQSPLPYRHVTALQARSARTVPAKLALLRAVTDLDEELLGGLKDLFEYRNQIAHATIEGFAGRRLSFEERRSSTRAEDRSWTRPKRERSVAT